VSPKLQQRPASAGSGEGSSGDSSGPDLDLFLAKFRAVIIVLSGAAAGMEHVLDQRRVSLGRGPGVDLAFNDDSLAGEHAVLEFVDSGFRLRSLTDSAETCLEGHPVKAASLKPDDRFRLGALSFSYVVEPRSGA
jgi:hypothetical protein